MCDLRRSVSFAFLLILLSGFALAQVVYEPGGDCEISVEVCDADGCVRVCYPDG